MPNVKNLLSDNKCICILIKDAFTVEFCNNQISTNYNSFQPANLNYPTSYRNNERQIQDNAELSSCLFKTIEKYLPNTVKIQGVSSREDGNWTLQNINERIRICRYKQGQYFNKHLDGVYHHSSTVQSKLTFMIYLNGGNDEFAGGRTLFYASKEDAEIMGEYQPSQGDLIIFDHNLWHSGEEVTRGEKYILRSDVLYAKAESPSTSITGRFSEGHLGYIWKIIGSGTECYTAGRDRTIKVWNADGIKTQELNGHENSILDLILMGQNTLVSCSRDKSIRLWQREKGRAFQEVRNFQYHQSTVLGLAKVDDRRFLSCGADGVLNLIDIREGLITSREAHDEWAWAVSLLRPNLAVTIGEDGLLKIWKVDSFQQVDELKLNHPLTAVEYDKRSKRLYVGDVIGQVSEIGINENLELKLLSTQRCHTGKIWTIKSASAFLATGGEDNRVAVWTKPDLKLVKDYLHNNFVQDLIWTPEGLLSVSYTGEIRELSM